MNTVAPLVDLAPALVVVPGARAAVADGGGVRRIRAGEAESLLTRAKVLLAHASMTARRLGLPPPPRSRDIFDALELFAFVRPAQFCAPSAVGLALGAGGCSLSSQFDSMFGSNDQTGSITPPPGAKGGDQLPPAGDLAFARAAVKEVLARGSQDSSLPWENPATGARDLPIPRALRDAFGHVDCGIYAEVIEGGRIAPGDKVDVYAPTLPL